MIIGLVACTPGAESRVSKASPAITAVPPVAPTRTPREAQTTNTPSATLIPYATPQWFREAIVYEIFVRSFADSDGDGTGDLNGVTQRLDYIESLGADTIWLMPIYPSPSQHGYDVSDFYAVNPDYGTLGDLQDLVGAAHARDMRVLLDLVPSHLSSQNPLFQEALGKPEAERSDWFVWNNEAHTQYAGFAGNEEMPRFNHYNPEVVAYLTEAARFWLDLDGDGDFADGIDGFRVDNATFPPQEFLVALRQGVKAANPEAVLLGESWVHSAADLSRFFPDQFDALFDFPLYETLQGDPGFNGDGLLAGKGFPALLSLLLQEEAGKFPPQAMAVRFLSNHDTNRIASEVGRSPERQRLAAALLATLPGPVMVYYGEEIGMPGQKGGPPYWDNYRREPMDWHADETGPEQATWFQPEDRWNQPNDGVSVEEQETDAGSLLNFYRRALNLRRAHTALREGNFEILEVEAPGAGAWGFTRQAGQEIVVVVFNFSEDEQAITVTDFPTGGGDLTDLLSGQAYPASQEGKAYELVLPGASAVLLASE